MARAWHPFYFGDYINDTRHMPMIEHGAYLLLMSHYYQQGYLPANAQQLHRICMAFEQAEQDAIKSILDQYFTEKDGHYHHERIEEELKKASEISEKRSIAAKKKHAKARAIASASAEQKHTQSQSQSHKDLDHVEKGGETMEQKEEMRSIIEYLNEKAGKKFRGTDSNIKFIRARLGQGYTIDDLRAVVDRKVAEWHGTKMAEYLRPSTLFNDEKFNQYFGELGSPMPEKEIERPEWATMPRIDEQLPAWAAKNDMPKPGSGEYYPQYRQRLQRKIDERMNNEQ